jgi:charged multivesicular body protein 5
MASIEVKVRKLDGELARYKEQMSKMRSGPGKVHLKSLHPLKPGPF